MTAAQARVINPILTEVARGYKNADMIGLGLFPYARVTARGGNLIQFGKEAFKLYDTRRAPGGNVARINTSYTGVLYGIEDHSISEQVPIELMEDAAAVPGINLGSNAAMHGMDIIGLRLEKAHSDLAFNPALYAATNKITLAGVTQWSDPTSTPIANVETAKEAIRTQVGRRPNTFALGASVFAQIKQHPEIVDRLKHTSRDVATPEILAMLLGVQRVLVGDAIYTNAAGVSADVWGKHAVLAYTDISGLQDATRPSYGYTYRLANYPVVEQPWYDPNTRSWVYPVHDAVSATLPGAEAGYLFINAVA
jgi:hypothetical protein